MIYDAVAADIDRERERHEGPQHVQARACPNDRERQHAAPVFGAGLEKHHAERHQERQKTLRVEDIGFARLVSDRRGEITIQAQPDKAFDELMGSEHSG